MSERRASLGPRLETGGVGGCIDVHVSGTAVSRSHHTVFPQDASLTSWDEKTVEPTRIWWHEGGPDTWGR